MSKSVPSKAAGKKESAISKNSSAKGPAADPQMTAFDKAMKLFHKRDFEGALPQFEEASKGQSAEIRHAAQLHARMCLSRVKKQAPTLKTADDHYAYGVALTTQRQLEDADKHLSKALSLAPKSDHILYALALVKGLSGDMNGAAQNLAKAIELQPGNRASARNDPDFQELLGQSPLRELVHAEKIAGH